MNTYVVCRINGSIFSCKTDLSIIRVGCRPPNSRRVTYPGKRSGDINEYPETCRHCKMVRKS